MPAPVARAAGPLRAGPRSHARIKISPVNDAQATPAPHIRSMPTLIVWHDGACPLCRREIALMRWLDTRGAILFVDAVTAEAVDCPLDRCQLLGRFHASANGELLSGAAAFAAMWRAIPVLRPLGSLARAPAMLALLERAYLGFLTVRPSLQRLARSLSPS